MNVDSLRVLVNVSRTGSFAATARSLNTDPSIVSRTIASLERELGIRLLQRNTRSMALTEAGALYVNRIDAIIEELDRAQDEAHAVSSEPTGVLRMTSSVAYGQTCIAPLMSEFSASYPEVGLELLFTDDMLDLVADRIDLAVRLAPAKNDNEIRARLCDTCYRVCASIGYLEKSDSIIKPEDLTQHSVLQFGEQRFQNKWRFVSKDEKETEVNIAGTVVVSNSVSLKTMLLNGMGPALITNYLIDDAIARGDCVDLFPDYRVAASDFGTGVWLVYPSRSFLPQKVRAMISFLQSRLGSAVS